MYKFFLTTLSIVFLTSCGNDESGNARLQVSLVDAPAEYDAVKVDVQEVNVRFGPADSSEGENGWQDISDFEPREEGIDLLKLVNGEEEVLVDREIPTGTLGEIRLVLGDNNTLTMGGETVNLTIPSGSESGLKIKLNEELLAGITYKLILDFDAASSVVSAGSSGKYNLKPVIHASMEAQTGAISGSVSPVEEGVAVYAVVGEDSVSTYTDAAGQFLLRALDPNGYEVVAINATDTVRTDEPVNVVIGEVSDVGELVFPVQAQ